MLYLIFNLSWRQALRTSLLALLLLTANLLALDLKFKNDLGKDYNIDITTLGKSKSLIIPAKSSANVYISSLGAVLRHQGELLALFPKFGLYKSSICCGSSDYNFVLNGSALLCGVNKTSIQTGSEITIATCDKK